MPPSTAFPSPPPTMMPSRARSCPWMAGRRRDTGWTARAGAGDRRAHLHGRGHAGGPRHRGHAGGCRAARSDGRDRRRIPPGLKAGANVRKAGEDVEGRRDVLSRRGAVLRPQDLAALASIGAERSRVLLAPQGRDHFHGRRGDPRRPASGGRPSLRCQRTDAARA